MNDLSDATERELLLALIEELLDAGLIRGAAVKRLAEALRKRA